ncbi:succinate dehydrogenase, cytochrome b556 subunit [Neorickettsia helminthoeca str. Oregon]|uniref:Succinate dehydrogenase cytochrome b556 subunit n=1 Tax=Neorickettsia helminthoeca str. Oregon TaxID=1286528 RepID=X5H2Z3_9RICK|nr:succinate dehydrogenase, cytochrome b556 subunit [Neorickettsia helminthoeca]AHX11023.1 succinate dehydrogenase, cytochrome b556 subunit [Neorickettsia helminthoeca str. Oregon]
MEPPISPHLQIYRLPFAALLSISHRITGFLLSLLLISFIWYVFAFLYFPSSFFCSILGFFFSGLIGRFFSFSFLLFFCYHFCSGLRHLFCDYCGGFSQLAVKLGNFFVVASSILLFLFVLLSTSLVL